MKIEKYENISFIIVINLGNDLARKKIFKRLSGAERLEKCYETIAIYKYANLREEKLSFVKNSHMKKRELCSKEKKQIYEICDLSIY